MARIVNKSEYAVRRNAILDAARRLIATKGYEQMAIQDILDDLQISKGAFYHYFDSKSALLEAVIERLGEEAEPLFLTIVGDPQLSALAKLERIFITVGRWKAAQKPFMLELLRVWYTDENAIVRQKVRAIGIQRVAPLYATIIRQGIAEGVFTTAYPEQMGRIVLFLLQDLADALAGLLLAVEPHPDDLRRSERIVAAYTDALERVLGCPPGSLVLMDDGMLREWFGSLKATA
jgi:AcrR family transcriptional regulator